MANRYAYQSGQRAPSLTDATATGAGDEFMMHPILGGQLPESFVWDVVLTYTVIPTGLRVDLEGTMDGTNWYQLDTWTTVGSTIRTVTGKKAIGVRSNLITLTGGTNPKVSSSFAT